MVRVSHFVNVVGLGDDIERPLQVAKRNDSDFAGLNLRENLQILQDPEVYKEYILSKKNYFDLVSIVPSLVITVLFVSARFNLSHITNGGPFFLVAHILVIICMIIFWPFFFSHCVIYCTSKDKCERLIYKISYYIVHSTFGGQIEDILCILSTISVGFILLARVLEGQCNSTTDVWESQR
jgi:hypothetical protein